MSDLERLDWYCGTCIVEIHGLYFQPSCPHGHGGMIRGPRVGREQAGEATGTVPLGVGGSTPPGEHGVESTVEHASSASGHAASSSPPPVSCVPTCLVREAGESLCKDFSRGAASNSELWAQVQRLHTALTAPCVPPAVPSEAGIEETPKQDTKHPVLWYDDEVAGVMPCGSSQEMFTVSIYEDIPDECPDCGVKLLLYQRQYVYMAAEHGAPSEAGKEKS